MANKRMFSLDVVDTDRFLEMPVTAQALYFHLGMRADDDGFISSPKKILKIANCTNDDLKILFSKGYVIPFESGVLVIVDWKLNNLIKSDRYKPTRCQDELKLLEVKDGSYIMNQGISERKVNMEPERNHYGISPEPQVRLGKNSIDKNIHIVEQSPTYPVKEVIDYLNQKTGKHYKYSSEVTKKHIKARFREGFTLEDFKRVIDWKKSQWTGTDLEIYLRPQTLFGTKFESYLNEIPKPRQVPEKPPEESEQPIDLWSED